MEGFNLVAKLLLDSSPYEESLSGLGGKITGLLGKISVAAIAAKLTKEVVDFAKASVEAGKQFDNSMSQVAATMGVTVDEIQDLRKFAQEMGATTAFTATQAADALNYMALAGYDAQTSMSMLPNVLNLAAAGAMDLATASDMITDTQTAFGISLDRTTQMVDEMAKAASTGNTNVQQLGEAFLVVGGLAQELNGGFITLADGTQASVDGIQEMEIVLTAMANAGIKGSSAGTHLRNMIMKLSSPTKEGAAQMEALGVKVFDADGNMRSLNEIMGDLSVALGNLTQEEKINAISDLFNARDLASAEALLNAVGSDWDYIGEQILNAQGAAQQMADTQLDNLAGDITLMNSALEGLQIALSDELTPELRNIVQWGTEGLGKITVAIREGGIMGAVSELGELLGTAVGAFFANLPNIAVEAVKGATTALLSFADGINKGLILSAFDESTYHAEDISKAYENVIHLQEQLNTVTSQHLGADMAASYRVALEEANEHLQELRGNEEARIGVLEQVASGTMSYKEASDYLGVSIDAVAHMLVLWQQEAEETTDAMEAAADSAEDVTDELGTLTETLSAAYPAYTKALEGAGYSLEQLADYLTLNGVEAEDWADAVDGATKGVINSFSELDTSMDMSLEEMAQSLEKNINAYHDWNENIDTLMLAAQATGDATKIAFVQYMADMGIGAAEQVALMVEDIDGTLDTFGPLFEQAAQEGIDGVVIGIDYGTPTVTAEANSMVNEAASSASGTAYTQGSNVGYQLSSGVAAGIGNAGYLVSQAAANTVTAALNRMTAVAEIASPSKLFQREVGQWIPAGVAQGIQKNTYVAVQAADSLMSQVATAASKFRNKARAEYDANTDYSELMLKAETLSEFFSLSDVRDLKIAGEGIDLAAEGWSTTADLLSQWMEINGAYVEETQLQTEELTAEFAESIQDTQTESTDRIIERMDRMSEQLDEMTATIASIQVVLDDGTLVGQMTTPLNVALGQESVYDARGI